MNLRLLVVASFMMLLCSPLFAAYVSMEDVLPDSLQEKMSVIYTEKGGKGVLVENASLPFKLKAGDQIQSGLDIAQLSPGWEDSIALDTEVEFRLFFNADFMRWMKSHGTGFEIFLSSGAIPRILLFDFYDHDVNIVIEDGDTVGYYERMRSFPGSSVPPGEYETHIRVFANETVTHRLGQITLYETFDNPVLISPSPAFVLKGTEFLIDLKSEMEEAFRSHPRLDSNNQWVRLHSNGKRIFSARVLALNDWQVSIPWESMKGYIGFSAEPEFLVHIEHGFTYPSHEGYDWMFIAGDASGITYINPPRISIRQAPSVPPITQEFFESEVDRTLTFEFDFRTQRVVEKYFEIFRKDGTVEIPRYRIDSDFEVVDFMSDGDFVATIYKVEPGRYSVADSIPFTVATIKDTTVTSVWEEISQSQLNVYPNPVIDRLTIDLPDHFLGLIEVRVVNQLGQVFVIETKIESGRVVIDCDGFVRGLYVVYINAGAEQWISPFVKH